ncbi:unnamed protein product [Arctia plantaginis]|uniref:Uncharacterized protein n=1 Tax=Arctia plantaginis TaxID=874455 RepID=A0A8S0ZWJ0_ARCPL|nr:unnamed protein product [Arctia plantaginis]
MASRFNLIISAIIITFMFNIEIESRHLPHHGLNQTLEDASVMFTDFPLGISEVFDDASGVFGKVLGKLMSKKKFLGIESFYEKK